MLANLLTVNGERPLDAPAVPLPARGHRVHPDAIGETRDRLVEPEPAHENPRTVRALARDGRIAIEV